MNLKQCMAAYTAATQLYQSPCAYETAYAIFRLKQALQPHVDFYAQKELELAKQYGKKDGDGQVQIAQNGKFELEDPAQYGAYMRSRKELNALDVRLDWTAPICQPPETVTPAQLEALSALLSFTRCTDGHNEPDGHRPDTL